MKKTALILAISFFQMAFAQEKTSENTFNFEPRVRIHGILPISFGDNYLAKANKSQLSVGANLSMFEYYKFRFSIGVDHVLYDTTDRYMAADVTRSRNTSFYGIVSYEIPLYEKFSVQPYLGAGWTEMYFRRSENSGNFTDVSIKKQHGSEFRAGFYLDYEATKIISFYTGVNYVGANYTIHTTPELESYFGKAQTMQVNLGVKLGYSMKDKRKKQQDAANKN